MRTQRQALVHPDWEMDRRTLLKTSAVSLTSLMAGSLVSHTFAEPRPNTARFGIVTDTHYAGRVYGTRYCNESLDKLAECVELMNKQEVDFLVELGDLKDYAIMAENWLHSGQAEPKPLPGRRGR